MERHDGVWSPRNHAAVLSEHALFMVTHQHHMEHQWFVISMSGGSARMVPPRDHFGAKGARHEERLLLALSERCPVQPSVSRI